MMENRMTTSTHERKKEVHACIKLFRISFLYESNNING